MAFGSALVDRARVIRNEPQPQKVDGRTTFHEVTSSWFRARLSIGDRPRSKQGNIARSESHPRLLFGPKDVDGNPILLTSEDRVEVKAVELGDAAGVFEVDGEPKPIRKRRSVIGFTANLKRVEPHEFKPRQR